MKRILRTIRLICILLPLVTLVWLIEKDFVFSGRMEMVYDFSRPSPFIQSLWPPQRLSEIERDPSAGDFFQRIRVEPVTFRVKLPRRFERATISVTFRKNSAQSLRLGIRADEDVWAWEIREFTSASYREDGWTEASIVVDDLQQFAGGGKTIDVLLNAPQLHEEGREILITEIRVLAEREPMTLQNVWKRGWSWLERTLWR